jgi:pyruvate dehydrogenase E2 component (dihydrolipoamide acetyltransferase)
MAQQAGLDLSRVQGSGPNGRIVKSDIEAAMARGPAAQQPPAQQAPAAQAPQPAAAPAPQPAAPAPRPAVAPPSAPHKAVPNSSIRKVIARRLSEAKQTIPHFYVSMDFELDALLKLRADLNAKSPKEKGAFKLSVNDMVIKAVATTLRRYPDVNAMWTDDAILQFEDVDVSVAVSTPTGLITPIIRKADMKGLSAISNEMKELASRAKANKLKPEEFQGGGFSISNMGMYGVRNFSAIINPPQAGILAVAAGEQRPVVKGGELGLATVMTCTLSVDHRVIDGALAAEFMQALKGVIEDPLSLML